MSCFFILLLLYHYNAFSEPLGGLCWMQTSHALAPIKQNLESVCLGLSNVCLRQVASMYMELCPEAGKQLHTTMCNSIDSLPSRKLSGGSNSPRTLSSDGAPPPGGGNAFQAAHQPCLENRPLNDQEEAAAPESCWDIEQGRMLSGGSSVASLAMYPSRLTSIAEDGNSSSTGGGDHWGNRSLPQHMQPPGGPSLMRTKSLPGPVLIPSSVFHNVTLPFAPRPAMQRDWGDDAHGGGLQCLRPEHLAARIPFRPSGKQGLRDLLLNSVASSGTVPGTAFIPLAERPPQQLQSPDRGEGSQHPGAAPSAGSSSAAETGLGAMHEGCTLCNMSKSQQESTQSAWMKSRSTSFRSDDNPFG